MAAVQKFYLKDKKSQTKINKKSKKLVRQWSQSKNKVLPQFKTQVFQNLLTKKLALVTPLLFKDDNKIGKELSVDE